MVVSKRTRIYTAEDVAAHGSAKSTWISRAGKVYDVTNFLNDHPGGEDLILKYAGHDVEQVMQNRMEHEHSDAAYDMLQEFQIGKLGTEATVVSDDWQPTDDFQPEDTDVAEDFEKNEFLDLRRPLLKQILESSFSKSYYLRQVHQPRHLRETARLFGPDYLEVLTRTAWYVVPLFWLPITAALFLRSLVQFSGPTPAFLLDPTYPLSANALQSITPAAILTTMACWSFGAFFWTLLEYGFHRFLFHIDDWLPDRPFFLMLHFLLHGVHHYLPMDSLRLVMPPTLFFILSFPMTRLAHALFYPATANGVISGSYTFYILYDCMHYALHHTQLPTYIREMKKYHLAHHYKNFELGFGVTSKIWDYVFNTVLPV